MLVIRLRRVGKKNQPAFKIIVTEKKKAPTKGLFIEEVGFWNPLTKERILKEERIKHWISVGAKPSDTVHNMLIDTKVIDGDKIKKHGKKKVKEGDKTVKEEKKEEIKEEQTEEKKEEVTEEAKEDPKEEKKEESKEKVKDEIKKDEEKEVKKEEETKKEEESKK